MINAFISKETTVIVILGLLIIILLVLSIKKNLSKIKTTPKDKKKVIYLCSVISKREYINELSEHYYYVKFKINEEEREFLVPKSQYFILVEGISGKLTLLNDKIFLEFK